MDQDSNFLNILKDWYRPGVESLLLRDDPFVNLIRKVRVAGEKYVFNALYDHGGGFSADYDVSFENATKVAHNAKFTVPIINHQAFSSYFVNSKQIAATVNERGSFIVDAANDMAAATDSFRKNMICQAYGNAYGQISKLASGTAFVINTPTTISLKSYQIFRLGEDQTLVVKAALNDPDASKLLALTVSEIDEDTNTITVIPSDTVTLAADAYLTVAGATDPSGNPILPSGVLDWLPIKNARSGAPWKTFISTSFNGVNRAVAPARLAGNFYYNSSNTTYKQDLYGLAAKVRRHASKAPLAVVNDNDYVKIMSELDNTNRIFTDSKSRSKEKDGSMGWDTMSISVSKSYIDRIIDSPAMPEGLFLLADPDTWELVCMTRAEKIDSNVSSDAPGGATVEQLAEGALGTKENNEKFGLLIDDLLAIHPAKNYEGPGAVVSLQFFGDFVCVAPGKNGIGILHDATPADIIGY